MYNITPTTPNKKRQTKTWTFSPMTVWSPEEQRAADPPAVTSAASRVNIKHIYK